MGLGPVVVLKLPLTIASTLLLQAAAAAAGAQHYPAGALYVVATPIGNLADLGLRAIHVLARVQAVACEDTRVTGQLLRHLGLSPALIALHEHNERQAAQQVLARLARGESVAYVSDAGTPAVSDPGAALVAEAAAAGHRVIPIPGPSSVLAALSVAGDTAAAAFRVVGFLPARGAERDAALDRLAADDEAQVLLESPHRIVALAEALAARVPQRRLTVGRELTKQFEAVVTLTAAGWPAWLAADEHHRRGEFVVVLHAQPRSAAADEELPAEALRALQLLMAELPLKQAVKLAAELTGAPRNSLYARALALRDGVRDEEQAP